MSRCNACFKFCNIVPGEKCEKLPLARRATRFLFIVARRHSAVLMAVLCKERGGGRAVGVGDVSLL